MFVVVIRAGKTPEETPEAPWYYWIPLQLRPTKTATPEESVGRNDFGVRCKREKFLVEVEKLFSGKV